jgi:hypothetical protein
MNAKTNTAVRSSKIQVRSAVRAGAAPVACRGCCDIH